MRSLITEMKRRKVFRVAVVYAVVAFVVLQVADLLFPAILLPEWAFRLLVVLVALGFPIALVLAWAFELTPEGMKRAESPSEVVSGPPRSQRALFAGSVLIAAVLGAALAAWYLRPEAASGVPTIAVLPFDNLSGSEENEYFSDGITEDILTQLSKIRELRVISRQSVMQYKNTEKSMREIAAELDASHIVEGSARRAASQVRVTAQLVDARDDRHLWASSYDRELSVEAIFQIQSEIAEQIARALEARLSPEQRGRPASAPTHDLTAYDYFLRARELARTGTLPDMRRAIAFLRQAIAEDPEYAPAYAGLAHAFTALEGAHGLGAIWLDSARVAAERAIELDPSLADGHSSLALVQWNSGQLAEAVETYARALELRPNDPSSLWGLAFTKWIMGELDEAARLAERAVQLDPLTPNRIALLGRCQWALGWFEQAEATFRRALQLQPDNPWAHDDLLILHISQGEYKRAAEQLRITEALLPGSPEFLLNAGVLALLQGDYEAAKGHLEEALRVRPESPTGLIALGFVNVELGEEPRAHELLQRAEAELGVDPVRRGLISVARGERAQALDWLERAYENGWRGWPTIDIANHPFLESLREEPRFQELRARILEDVERMRERVERNRP